MLGWVGHRNGDRDCEPAELTEHQARDGGKLGRASPAYRAPEPRHGRPMAGFCYTRKGQDAERLGVSTYCGEVPKLGGPSDRSACQEEIGTYSSIIGNARCTASKTAWQITEGTAREIGLSDRSAPGIAAAVRPTGSRARTWRVRQCGERKIGGADGDPDLSYLR